MKLSVLLSVPFIKSISFQIEECGAALVRVVPLVEAWSSAPKGRRHQVRAHTHVEK